MQRVIEASHANQKMVKECARHLERLARAASMLGQKGLADDLFEIADDIQKSADGVVCAMSDDLNQHTKDVQKATGNMLLAALGK